MKRSGVATLLVVFCLAVSNQGLLSQDTLRTKAINSIADSLKAKGFITRVTRERPVIELRREEAIRYLQAKYISGDWTNPSDPLRMAIGNLIYYASHPPFDSVRQFLRNYAYDSINLPFERFYDWDSINMKIPVILQPQYINPSDSIVRKDTIGLSLSKDSVLMVKSDRPIDSTMAYKPVIPEQTVILKDTVLFIARDSITEVLPYSKDNPFWVYRYPYQGDSLAAAVNYLTDYLTEKDSSMINFLGVGGSAIPVWLNSKSGMLIRYWLKNDLSDSVTVWIGSLERNSFSLYLEDGIMFRRLAKQTNISDAQLNLKQVNTSSLQDVNKIYIKPRYWKLRSESNFVLNQALLANWVKGGESSFSTAMDIIGFADYNNKQLKLLSNNFIRLKYGLVMTEGTDVKKNLDLLETNSKLNHKAFGKFDFSGTMLFKTQVSKGYNYAKINGRDTSVLVSRFMNPATLTLGLGLDYKPNKTTSINLSPFSYKGTFVPDTATIDQTKYGVPSDRTSMHEPGGFLQITNEYKPFKTITVTNRVQLFTNYINKPQNIDIDWEMILTAKLNWFTDVRFNTHFIYDDDTRTVKLNKDDSPVMGEDGKPVKNARAQFKELLGFSFVFRF